MKPDVSGRYVCVASLFQLTLISSVNENGIEIGELAVHVPVIVVIIEPVAPAEPAVGSVSKLLTLYFWTGLEIVTVGKLQHSVTIILPSSSVFLPLLMVLQAFVLQLFSQ